MPVAAEERAPSPLPPLGHDISRPSSTSTQSSNALRPQQYQQQQNGNYNNVSLPALSTLASVATAPSPQLRAYNSVSQIQNMNYATTSPAASSGPGNTPPVCQNCQTSTTPLWRRDEIGSVLCNACGLFLKLHGRPRPISLKTDVIKSRNRVKSAGQSHKKRSLFDANGPQQPDAGTPPPNHQNHNRRIAHRHSSGGSDRSNSPVTRTATPSMQHPPNIAPQHLFDGVSLTEHAFQQSPSLPALGHLRQPSPGSTTSLNDRHLEPPQTYEALQRSETTLKTRVSELEVINDLFRGRVQQLENEAAQLRLALDEERSRMSPLKRRNEELECELSEYKDESGTSPKRQRLTETEYPDPPQPLTAAL